MRFSVYQYKARRTAIYPNLGHNLWYPALGLCGESGEVAEKIKKAYRDENGTLTPVRRAELEKELGDVPWYIANLASEAGLDLEDVAEMNLDKLARRKETNKLHSSGDDR